MRVFDIHVHIFPQKIAVKAATAIGNFYHTSMAHDGTLDTYVRLAEEAQIDMFAAHSVATTPAQCARINAFIMEAYRAYPQKIIPFAAIHPNLENVDEYVDSALEQGFRGFKIHPDIQNFPLDSPNALRMIAAVAGKAPLLIHTGDARYANSNPVQTAKILDMFPRLTIIGAHLGGYTEWDAAKKLLAGRDMYVDCSSTLFELNGEKAVELMRAYGTDRVFFGTDYPMWTPAEELRAFLALPLTQEEQEQILWKNAAKFFRLQENV